MSCHRFQSRKPAYMSTAYPQTPCLDCGAVCLGGYDLCPECIEALLEADEDEWREQAALYGD